jgi:putative DNA primase/helicase
LPDDLPDRFPCTDLGNAERLAAWHGADLRHVPAWSWMVWTGKFWERGDKLARERAHQTVRQIYRRASSEPDKDRRENLVRWAVSSENSARITAILREAESFSGIRAESLAFDRDAALLNVANGTIELRTGELRAHRREDLITKLIDLDFRVDARSELWDGFLLSATDGKDGLSAFLRRAAGYTISGSTKEEIIFVLHGPGETGKTTFVETLKVMLGPYAGSVRVEVLTTSGRSGGGHNEDIARLVGLRMVTAVEASENEQLREGLVKHLTGGDTIPASLKHKPGFDFVPAFKLWLATNDVPHIRSDDSGMWRRVLKLPFEHKHPRSNLKGLLKTKPHQEAILAWAVQGCLDWQREGLNAPESVLVATTKLRRQMDGLDEFLTLKCNFEDPHCWTPIRDIRASYTQWAEQQSIPEPRRVNQNRMADALQRKGCEFELRKVNEQAMRGWWGIRVMNSNGTFPEPASSEVEA